MSKHDFLSHPGRDKIIRAGLVWSVGLWFLSSVSLGVLYHRLPPQVPLFYSLVEGSAQLAPRNILVTLPIASLIFILAHAWIARISYDLDITFARITAVTSIVVTFLFTLALMHIIMIVI